MPRITAIANQKGGVAKSTSAHALAAGLVELGASVLAIDLDPQASLSWAMGVEPDELDLSLHDVLMGRSTMESILFDSNGIDLAPSSIDMAGSEVHLHTKTGREYVLKRALADVEDSYDHILIDCPPSLGILTINGLTAADRVIVPVRAETLSQRGVDQLRDTIGDVRLYTNPDLELAGIIITMHDARTRLGAKVIARLVEAELPVWEPAVPRSVKVAEAPERGLSVLDTARTSKPAAAYRALSEKLHT